MAAQQVLTVQDERPQVDALFMQDRAAGVKAQGAGEVVYFMPGHVAADYEHPSMAQMILNSITGQP